MIREICLLPPKIHRAKTKGEDDAHDERCGGFVKESVCPEGVCNIEGRHKVETAHIGQDQKDSEQNADPVLFQRCLDIVGGTAVGAPVLRFPLIDLCQRTLDKGGALPRMAVSHIQNTAPAAAETDGSGDAAILPVPTLEAVDTISAWKEDSPFPSVLGCATTRMDSANRRNWTNLVRTEK